jgi:hypothetical protein
MTASQEQAEQAAATLAGLVYEQWCPEAQARALGDPEPMPVRWRLTTPDLMDRARILADGFGPNGQYYSSSFRSATSPPRGNPPALSYMGQAFEIEPDLHLLSRIELALSTLAGDGRAQVRVAVEQDGQPGGTVASWDIKAIPRSADSAAHLVLRPEEDIYLQGASRYWVYLVAPTRGGEVAWWSGDQILQVATSRIGELHTSPPWRVSDVGGVGYALKVVAIPQQRSGPPLAERQVSTT